VMWLKKPFFSKRKLSVTWKVIFTVDQVIIR
jgi:hypothetical protein